MHADRYAIQLTTDIPGIPSGAPPEKVLHQALPSLRNFALNVAVLFLISDPSDHGYWDFILRFCGCWTLNCTLL